jgi:hypothetical protein
LLIRVRQVPDTSRSLTFAIVSPVLSPTPSAWIVNCTGCGCAITCFAIDPQTEHMHPSATPPQSSAVVTCSCCWASYRYEEMQITRGEPKRNPSCAKQTKRESKSDGAMLIAASIVAAIRLRGAEIRPSPKLTAVVHDSLLLAKMVLAKMGTVFPPERIQ